MPGPAGFLTLAFFLLLIPYGAFKTRAKMGQLVAMPREKYFRSVAIQQLVLAAVALVAVLTEHVWIAPVGSTSRSSRWPSLRCSSS